MEQNKTGKYFKYAIGEILLVVIGILIALSINNWNENNKRDIIRQGYYRQLLEDLDKDKIYIENRIILFDSLTANYSTYIETYKEPSLSLEQAFVNILKLNLKSTSVLFNTSTLESLLSTGDIKLIPPYIRNKLIDLKRKQDMMLKVAGVNDNGKNEILQNLSMEIGSGSLIESLENQPILREYLNIESKFPKTFLLLEAALDWKNISETRTLGSLKKILIDNKTLVELITNELKK